jgi:hypothetical protein
MRKGEIAFSTSVSIIIAAVVLITILIWLIPGLSESLRQTFDIVDSAGVNDEEIIKLDCQRLCVGAQTRTDVSTSEFCTNEVSCPDLVECEDVNCNE